MSCLNWKYGSGVMKVNRMAVGGVSVLASFVVQNPHRVGCVTDRVLFDYRNISLGHCPPCMDVYD